MIAGWREIAKMLGYYEPERRKIDVSVSAKRMVDQFETMSDEELLRLAGQAEAVAAEG
jgi:phage terminase small subunit